MYRLIDLTEVNDLTKVRSAGFNEWSPNHANDPASCFIGVQLLGMAAKAATGAGNSSSAAG